MILYFHKRPQQPGQALAPIKLTGVEDVNGSSSGFWDTGKQGFIIPTANHNNFFGRDAIQTADILAQNNSFDNGYCCDITR
jgi:hypothetical protein